MDKEKIKAMVKKIFPGIDQGIRYIIYALLIIVPVIYDTKVKSVFITPKLFSIRIGTLLILLLWLIKIYWEGKLTFLKTKINKPLIFWAGIIVLNTIFSTYVFSSLFGNYGRFLGIFTLLNFLFLAFIVVNFFKTRKQITTALIISSLTAVLISLWAILQYQGLVDKETAWSFDPELRVFATFGHSNHFAAYLVFHFMLVLGLILMAKRWWQKGLGIIAEIVFISATLATASRGALFALVLALVIFLILLIYYSTEFIKKHYKKLGLGILILMFLIGIFRNPIWGKLKEFNVVQRTISTIDFVRQGNVPDRVSWWKSSLAMIKDRPILGFGLSTFKENYNKYRRSDYRVPADEQDEQLPETAHMEYFNIAATQGVLGLMVYLYFIGIFFGALIKFSKQTTVIESSFLSLGILTAVVSYLLQVLMNFGTVETLFFFYVFIGLGMALVLTEKNQEEKIFINWKLKFKNILAGIGVFLILGSGYSAYQYYKVEYLYRLALAASEVKLYDESLSFFDELTTIQPHEYVYWSGASDTAFEAALEKNDFVKVKGYLDYSLSLSQTALSIAPNQPNLEANLALTYFALQKAYEQNNQTWLAEEVGKQGILAFKQAIADSPNNPLYLFRFGQVYHLGNNLDQSIFYIKQALEMRPDYPEANFAMAQIYFEKNDLPIALNYLNKALEQKPAEPQYLELKGKIGAS